MDSVFEGREGCTASKAAAYGFRPTPKQGALSLHLYLDSDGGGGGELGLPSSPPSPSSVSARSPRPNITEVIMQTSDLVHHVM